MATVEAIIDKTISSAGGSITCEQCGRTFRKPSKLQRHVDQTHNNMRKFQCQTCQRLFKRKQQLKRHQVSHTHQKNYPCAECPMRFGYKHHMQRHVKLVHLKQLYKCQECLMEFMKKRSLSKHMKEHVVEFMGSQKNDKNQEEQTKSLQIKRTKKIHKQRKLWLCDYCNTTYYKLVSLKKHMLKQHPQKNQIPQVFLEDVILIEKADTQTSCLI